MAEISFENGRIFNFKGLVTLTLDRVILHTVVHHSSTSTHIPNIIEIKENVYGRTDGRRRTFETRSTLSKSRSKNNNRVRNSSGKVQAVVRGGSRGEMYNLAQHSGLSQCQNSGFIPEAETAEAKIPRNNVFGLKHFGLYLIKCPKTRHSGLCQNIGFNHEAEVGAKILTSRLNTEADEKIFALTLV